MTITVLFTHQFIKSSQRLPTTQQRKLVQLLLLFKKQPFDTRLHTKPLVGALTGVYSFRITRDWRVVFQFLNSTTIKLIDVAHRKDIYR